MKIKKISEQQAKKMLEYAKISSDNLNAIEVLDMWKAAEYIEKSVLEYAEEYQDSLSSGKVEYYTVEQFNRQKELYQLAIEELKS